MGSFRDCATNGKSLSLNRQMTVKSSKFRRQRMSMIRKVESRVRVIGKTCEELLPFEAEHGSSSGWKLGVCPTEQSAAGRAAAGEMYVRAR